MSLIDYCRAKTQYLMRQRGGGQVPDFIPETHSWLFMPIILAPFDDVEVVWPVEFDILIEAFRAGADHILTLAEIVDRMEHFYIGRHVNLCTRLNLQTIGKKFDDSPLNLHLPGKEQDELLEEADLKVACESAAMILLSHADFKGKEFTFKVK